MNHNFKRRKNSIFHPAVISLMVISTLLNILLSMVVKAAGLPIYVDTVGTIVASALGGVVPGLLTAFATNVFNFFMDSESIFYVSINMLIAVLSACYFGDFYFHYKKQRKKNKEMKRFSKKSFFDLVLFVFVLALVGGVFGGYITWFLYETPSDVPVVKAFSEWVSKTYKLDMFGCHMVSSYIFNLVDKTISLIAALLIIRIIPKKVREYTKLSSWRQKPISFDVEKATVKKLKGRMSIGTRINFIIIFSTFLMTVVAFVFSFVSFRKNTLENLTNSASQAAYLAANSVDGNMVEEYLKSGSAAPGYAQTMDQLSIIKNSSSEIEFLYVYKFEKDGCHVVFDLDATLSDGSYIKGDVPGTVVDFEQDAIPHLNELLKGEMIQPVQMEDEYGSYITAFYPVYDDNGKCVCYAISNIKSGLINDLLEKFSGRVLLLFAGFLLLVVAISILTTRYRIVMPILSMTAYANEIADTKGGVNEESFKKIEELNIHTGDEVELLYRALCNLTGDTLYQLSDNQKKSEAISKMQSALLITMADMVESRDSDTGAHVLKTAAYVRIILKGLKRNGYYAEKLSDKYIRDVEMSAPLHDVGKINIPDAILNKPGKLTDEEFEIMKTHTTAGRIILENAISSMEGDNYLKEARNMAAYHHERWDGKGYPEGLHGEVIPLSARVMAVADVFDALSSPRVYKPAFPFDKAVSMIQEGAGTQFDPKCVEVFLESLPEVKKVLKRYQEK